MDFPQSKALFERAHGALAGGTSSSSRITTTGSAPHPLYFESGAGARVRDADGNEYIDYLLAYGSAVLGHASPQLADALTGVLKTGTMFGTCNVPEIELAEKICELVPCADLVRYANSGSEAVQGAVRAARGFTGRSVIVKFEGHYHGWSDTLGVSTKVAAGETGPYETPHAVPQSRGIPDGVVNDVVVCPWNDMETLRAVLDAHEGRIAALICEPIVANNACTQPLPGYLAALREECDRRGILLIFDEVCTGFRVHPGGAQALFEVTPDLAVFSKALGGGLPIAAFAGRRDIMEQVGANRTKHGGTYNGSPLCATAALTTLTELADPAVQSRIDTAGHQIQEAIRRSAHDHGVPCVVQGVGAMFQVIFGRTTQTHHYRDLFEADLARYERFRHELLLRGIHVNVYGLACWFVSAAHGDDEVAATCAAVSESIAALAAA
ncbi:aspartate aminotransferase family protein [Streptomyces boninensis]|uniref:aspartate aminotransferase family protein n=1 Tax=Streptomyces boninensis TaxID=2039455 RepID=UPI003B20D284